jgi:hypothetical protein
VKESSGTPKCRWDRNIYTHRKCNLEFNITNVEDPSPRRVSGTLFALAETDMRSSQLSHRPLLPILMTILFDGAYSVRVTLFSGYLSPEDT